MLIMVRFLAKSFGCVILIMATVINGCASDNSNNQSTPDVSAVGTNLTTFKTPVASTPIFSPASPTPVSYQATSRPSFLCELVPEPELNEAISSENIYLSGKFNLCTYDGSQIAFDFDSGKLGNAESETTDIILVISSASIDNRSLYFLRETNNSYVAVSDLTLPTQEYCEHQTTAENRLTLVLSATGATGCVMTNEGRLAYFKIEQLDPFGLESVAVSFVTWKNK